MYCSNCGAELKEDDHFCGTCGNPVEENVETIQVEATGNKETLKSRRAGKKSRRKWIIIILAIVLVTVTGLILSKVFLKEEKKLDIEITSSEELCDECDVYIKNLLQYVYDFAVENDNETDITIIDIQIEKPVELYKQGEYFYIDIIFTRGPDYERLRSARLSIIGEYENYYVFANPLFVGEQEELTVTKIKEGTIDPSEEFHFTDQQVKDFQIEELEYDYYKVSYFKEDSYYSSVFYLLTGGEVAEYQEYYDSLVE